MSADIAIVRRVLDGDVEAFRVLVERHQSKLMGVLMNIVRDRNAAEEAAQDTFVKAYTKLATFRADSAFSTWLLQIGIHVARDRLRAQARTNLRGIVPLDDHRRQLQGCCEPADGRTSADPARSLESREQFEGFQQALSGLPEPFREAITLRHFEQLEYEQIARLTGESTGTMRVRTHRARHLLKERMEAMGIELGAGWHAQPPGPREQQEGT